MYHVPLSLSLSLSVFLSLFLSVSVSVSVSLSLSFSLSLLPDRYPFNDDQVVPDCEWEVFLRETAAMIITEQSPKRYCNV